MFKNERLNRIMTILEHKKVVSTTDLEKTLFVSNSTLRRDLMTLERLDKVHRSFGYVELVKADNLELPYLFRGQERAPEKHRIAATASVFLGDNQAIFIDSSSTASFLAPFLAKLNHVIVITNGLRIAVELDGLPNIKTFVTGGRLRNGAGSIIGDDAIGFLNNFRANLFFMSCVGLTNDGVFMSSQEQSSVKRAMMQHAEKTILLCDHSKYNVKSYYRLCHEDELEAVVSDARPDQPLATSLEKAGVEVLV
ncbi:MULTISPECIES: DeoR/GlpR family DNA-binding transcription regulator [Lacticaseibacillus]|uniref:DeoR/GlpR family DNA-binding transcription regulator n=1 Tax=Lacticaseibacillus TaxID=2759736 RepID=UPI00063DC6C9|nr:MULTISPECIES: DeoR/GlpR family DNA-binding transcription regulator [Lacticaseibacillus]KLI75736.1 DeoR faimly transcriptional regulator [Lacticaseibacillus casei]